MLHKYPGPLWAKFHPSACGVHPTSQLVADGRGLSGRCCGWTLQGETLKEQSVEGGQSSRLLSLVSPLHLLFLKLYIFVWKNKELKHKPWVLKNTHCGAGWTTREKYTLKQWPLASKTAVWRVYLYLSVFPAHCSTTKHGDELLQKKQTALFQWP